MPLSYEQLQSIVDAVPALISFVDTEYRYRMCNLAYTSWFGFSREQVIGRTMQEVLGDAAWKVLRPHVDAALAGEAQDFETEAIYRKGVRQIHAVYTPQRDADGHVSGIVILVTDITARKGMESELSLSEERFSAFVRTTSDNVYRMGPDWKEMRQLLGRDFTADTPYPSQGWLEKYIPPDDQAQVLAAIEKAIRARSLFQLEHRVIRADGSTSWTFSRAVPLFDKAGEIREWMGAATDVTERHRSDEALRESEERYRSLFASIDEGFCVIELIFEPSGRPVDYRFIEVNPAFKKHTGLHDATGKRMLEFVSHIEPHWLENYGRVAITGEPIRFAAEYSSLNRWFDVYAFRTGKPEGKRVAVLFNDITQRKLSEKALSESEERFRNISDNSPMMLWVTDADGRCVHLNKRWFQFTGQTPETGLVFGWLNAVHPEDSAEAERMFREANAKREVFRVEYRLRRYDGVYRWAIDAASPRFSDNGDYLGYIGSVIDIQDRKEAEEALRKSRERFDIVKDGAQVGFWFCDLPFEVLEWDNRVKEHFWLQPEATVTINTFYERMHPDDREPTRAAIEKSIAEKSRYDIEYRTVNPVTGAEKWIQAIGRTFYDADGQPIRFDGVTLDITEHKRSENALREAKEQAERASRAKDDFLAQLSHELRTPLTPVLMIAEALREDSAMPAFAREQLETIARNVALEARLIDDLLDLTRITHGKLALRAESCDVHKLLELVVEIVGEEAREKSIELRLELAAQRNQLSGDPARLQQVFWNLVRNAVKFTPEGGHVRIRSYDTAATKGEADARLCIEVSDDGVGFDPSMAERLFKPFERGTAMHDPRFSGLGLGLAIARAIVDLHGGIIRAESAGIDRGATFTVELPEVLRVSKAPASNGASMGQAIEPDPILRLLIVEDHAPTRDVVSRLLRRNGHHVTTAESVATALSAAKKETFDLVISDLGLPDGTGVELMTQLRDHHGLRGIAVSGYGTEEDMRRTAEAGFVAHLVKPVDLKEVRRAIRQFGANKTVI
jgi:PAS domain S-box-containing protein